MRVEKREFVKEFTQLLFPMLPNEKKSRKREEEQIEIGMKFTQYYQYTYFSGSSLPTRLHKPCIKTWKFCCCHHDNATDLLQIVAMWRNLTCTFFIKLHDQIISFHRWCLHSKLNVLKIPQLKSNLCSILLTLFFLSKFYCRLFLFFARRNLKTFSFGLKLTDFGYFQTTLLSNISF